MYFLKTKKWTPNGPKTNEHISLTYYIRVLSPNFIEMWSSVHQSIVPIWTRPHYSLMKKKINEKVGQNYGHQYQKSLLSINVGVYNFPRIQRSLARNHFFFSKILPTSSSSFLIILPLTIIFEALLLLEIFY